MICQDGYFVSHISGDVALPSVDQVERFLPPYKLPFALDPKKPVSHGPQIHPEQGPPLQLERARSMEIARRHHQGENRRVLQGFRAKLSDPFVEEFMLEDAEVVFVIQGGHAVTCQAAVKRLREQGIKAGMARLLWFRPFPTEDLQKALDRAKVVGVVETNLGPRRRELRRHPVARRHHRHVSRRKSPARYLVHGRTGRRDHPDQRVHRGWPTRWSRPWSEARWKRQATGWVLRIEDRIAQVTEFGDNPG